MKRTYQGYSGSGPTNPNLPAPPSLSYPPLPSGAPPPQPASSGAPNPAAVSNNPQYQPQQSSVNSHLSTSQPYQYNQFPGAASTPYGQYPNYPPQSAAPSYAAPIAPVAGVMGPYGYPPQLPANPQQQTQQPQQPHQHQQALQQPQHPAFPNYGYGAPTGPQQPPKGPPGNIAYHPQTPQYPNPNNPNIPANPYTGYATGQPNTGALQGSPGSVAPPPYKRPRYEAGAGGNAYSTPNAQQPHVYPSNQVPPHNAQPQSLPPLRHQNAMNNSTPTPLRMGSNTNNTRGGFSGGRGPRVSGGAFGNNSPIRLNLGNPGSFDGSGAPHFEASHPSHIPAHVSHPLPPHHQPQHSSPAQHYQPNVPIFNTNNNNAGTSEPHYPNHSGPHHGPNFNPNNSNDHSRLNSGQHGSNDSTRMNNNAFGHPDPGTGYSSGPLSHPNDNYGAHDDNRPGQTGNGNRSNRGGFRGGGLNGGGGRAPRDRGSDYGGDNSGGSRGGRGPSNNMHGSASRGDRHGSGARGRSVGNNGPNGRYDDHSSNYGGNGPRLGSHHDRMGGGARSSRNISNLPTMGGNNKGSHADRRNGGGGRYSNLPLSGDRNGRGGRRNGRDSKFDDHRHSNRGPRAHASGGGPDRSDRDRAGPGGSTRVRNGWGAQFKEFNDREKEKEKKEEVASTKRTLTDFRINALEITDLTWSWSAEGSERQIDAQNGATASTNVDRQDKTSPVQVEDPVTSLSKTGKHGRDEDEVHDISRETPVLSPTNPASTDSVTSSTATITASAKKVKSDATVELAKKIDEEAASAVKGLNLTVDDQGSELEESIVSDEVKNQLLLSKDVSSIRVKVETSPAAAEEMISTTQTGAPTTSEVTKTSDASHADVDQNVEEPKPDVSTPRPTPLDAQTPTVVRERERIHSYSKPTIPAGRENSRLRLYFSSPANVTAESQVPQACTSLPSKPPTSVVGHGGKRKLSISAHSAMSVDTRIGGGRGSSPVISPVKGSNKGNKAAKVNPDSTGNIPENNSVDTVTRPTETEKQAEAKEASGTALDTAQVQASQSANKEAQDTDVTAKDGNAATTNTTQSNHEPSLNEKEQTAETETAEARAAQEQYDEDADGDYEDEEDYEDPPMPEPQADRLSISYARNTRRMVIDSDVVESVKVYRAEHKIEVLVRLTPAIIQGGKYDGEIDEYRVCKGVLVEALDQEIDDYVIMDRAVLEAAWNTEEPNSKLGTTNLGLTEKAEDSTAKKEENDEETLAEDYEVVHDPLLPPLHRLFMSSLQQKLPNDGEENTTQDTPQDQPKSGLKVIPSFKQNTVLIVAKLDTLNPLTEAKWVRTGDVDSWISQMTGRIFRPEDHTECGWRRKITVVDPDPPPTIQHLLDTWLTTSASGTIETRQRFIDRHVSKNVDIIIEILLRVVRSGATGNSHHHTNPMPLIVQQAATLRAPYPEQQTQVSLAVLGLYRLSIETALEAGVPIEKVIKKATDIVRSLPYRLAFSALDGIYKDETSS
ncbi:hypothetical protein DFH28DRAFT_209879 [Melampsora americana]|nr:hypothetical protein DFH28DRAFT_209879 [Melampsora americana]